MPPVQDKHALSLRTQFLGVMRCLWCAFLVLVAFIQAAYLLVQFAPLQFALSQQKLRALHSRLQELGITYQSAGAYFDLTGAIILEKPSLNYLKLGGPALSCKLLEIQLSLWDLLQGRIVAEQLLCTEGELHLPLPNYKSSEGTLCAQKVYFQAKQHNGEWTLNHFNAEIFNLNLLACGPIPRDISKQINPDALSPSALLPSANLPRAFALEERLENILEHIGKIKTLLQHCENPTLTLLGQYDHYGAIELYVRGFAEQINTPGIQLTNATIQALLKNMSEGSFLDQPLTLKAEKFCIHDTVKGQWLYAQSDIELISFSNLAQERIEWNAHKLKTLRGEIPYIFGDFRAEEPTALTGRICAIEEQVWLNACGTLNLQSQSGQFTFEGQLRPDTLKQWAHELPWQFLPVLKFSKALFLEGAATFEEHWQPTYCSFQGSCSNGYVLDQPIEYATVSGCFQNRILDLTHFCIQSPAGWKTIGSYKHNFNKNEGRFLLHGSIDPNFLTPWLPEWWGPLWSNFTFQAPNWPKANLDISAPWDQLQSFSLFGRVEGNRFELRKINIPQANVMLHCTYNIVSINRIYIQTPKSTGAGSLFLRFEDGRAGPIQTIAAVDACLPVEFASIIPQAAPIASLFTAENPLRMEFYADQSKDELPQSSQNFFQLKMSAPFPLTFMGVGLDSLKLEARQQGPDIIVDPIIAGLASGQVQGKVVAHVKQCEPSLDIQATLIGAKREQILENVSYLNCFQKPFSINNPTPMAGTGTLDADFIGNITLPDWSSIQGQGRFHLMEADLGEIHFFGGLSRFLENLYIPIGTLTLDEAAGAFILKNETLTLPNAEIVGPTARIAVKGDFYIPTQNLDFQVEIFPLGRIPVISTAMILFRPFTKAFQLHLSGPLHEPVWQFSYISVALVP